MTAPLLTGLAVLLQAEAGMSQMHTAPLWCPVAKSPLLLPGSQAAAVVAASLLLLPLLSALLPLLLHKATMTWARRSQTTAPDPSCTTSR
jgi:hypothetical protein